MWIPAALAVVVFAAWPAVGAAGPTSTAGTERPTSATRPYDLQVPGTYDAGRPAPLVVLLHGYTSDGPAQKAYFRMGRVSEREGFLLAAPNGTFDPVGNRFWNATDACCNFFGSDVDDVAYLDAVIDEIGSRHNVDPKRIFLVGHSNGGFMAHRFACDRAGTVAAVVSLAGMQWTDAGRCGAEAPVSVLHVHGTDDDVIEYHGGETPGGAYPGAERTSEIWAQKNGCEGTLADEGEVIDIESAIPGPETSISRYPACGPSAVELWTIDGGSHVPDFDDRWAEAIWGFLGAHPRAG